MSGFFHGWRRKGGCILLAVAAAFAIGWLRSYYVRDSLQLPGRIGESFVSDDQSLHWLKEGSDAVVAPPRWPKWRSTTKTAPEESYIKFKVRERMFCGIGRRETRLGFYIGISYVVPYWFITIPLTLLSAYLILWPGKRATTPARNSETP